MPMIDAYASAGTFADKHKLAVDLAGTLMRIEQVPDIPMFRKNTAAFVHEMPSDSLSNVDGDTTYVRVQVLTNAGALDRDKQRSRGLRTMTCRPHGQRMTVHFETDPGRPRWPLTSWPTPHARRRRRSRCARPGQGRRCGSGKTRERVST